MSRADRPDARTWRRVGSSRLWSLGLVIALALTPAIAASAVWPALSVVPFRLVTGEPPPTLPPAQIVLLIDESGSLSADGVAREKEASRTIALGALARDTTVSVVGFGSSDGSFGQYAAITRCLPTKVDSAQSRDTLARCIDDVHARTPSEGLHTDHVAALRQALGLLTSGAPGAKIVFLLTDGNLDVEDSPAYGRDLGPEARNQAARDQIPGVLAEFREIGAQVWPLGFGTEVSLANLKAFETGIPCTPTATKPGARLVDGDKAALTKAITEAYSSAGCVGVGEGDDGVIPRGGSLDLSVTIPPIASDSSILVYKRHAGIQVEYIDPDNQTVSGSQANGSTFEFAGQGTETESLRIVDPVPGRWTVRLRSTSSIPTQDVAAIVLFQGAVNAVLAISPPQPAAGQEVEVAMQLRARRGAITDATVLSDLSFGLSMTGSRGVREQRAALTDEDQDGTFTTRLTVPASATGDLTFTGTVTGIGIGGDTRVFTTTVRKQPADLQGQLRLTGTDSTVEPGESVPGEASIDNRSDRERTLRLQAVNAGPGTIVTLSPSTITVPASGTVTVPFTVEFAPNTLIGGNQAQLQVVDDSDPSTVVAQQLIARDVALPPGIVESFLWLWIVLALLVASGLVVILARLRDAHRQRTVSGLRVELRCGGIPLHELSPLNPTATVFRFAIHDDGFTAAQLNHADASDAGVHELRRSGGELMLTPALGPSPVIQPGEIRSVRPDLALVVYDDRRSASRVGMGAGVTAAASASTSWDVFSGAGSGTAPVPGWTGSAQPQPYQPQPYQPQPQPDPVPPSDLWVPPDQSPQPGAGDADYSRWKDPHDPWSNS